MRKISGGGGDRVKEEGENSGNGLKTANKKIRKKEIKHQTTRNEQ